jgi:hypothetical protein
VFLAIPCFVPAALRAALAILIVIGAATPLRAQTAPGGFLASASDTGVRAPITAAAAQGFLPQRGVFSFPAPYLTQGIRITNASDCGGGDCVDYGYSYWNKINNHAGSNTMLIVVGLNRSRGGAGPTLFTYDKSTGETRNAGPLFDANSSFSYATAEQWYFSRTRPNSLYLGENGPRMLRYDVLSKAFETVFDVTSLLGGGKYLWQMHSSNDDRVHSATVKDSNTYQDLGCLVYREDTHQHLFYTPRGDYDECQIDKSGRWLVIKENVRQRLQRRQPRHQHRDGRRTGPVGSERRRRALRHGLRLHRWRGRQMGSQPVRRARLGIWPEHEFGRRPRRLRDAVVERPWRRTHRP